MKMFGNGVETIEDLVKSQSSELDKRLDKKLGRPINLHYDLGKIVFAKATLLKLHGSLAWVFSCKFAAYFQNTFS